MFVHTRKRNDQDRSTEEELFLEVLIKMNKDNKVSNY